MEQLMMMAMQTMQEFAQKHAHHGLIEFEFIVYSQLCETIKVFMKCQEHVFTANEIELQEALKKKQKESESGTEGAS